MTTFTAIAAAIIAAWGTAKGWFNQIFAHFVETTVVQWPGAEAIYWYVQNHLKKSRFSTNYFDARVSHVRPRDRSLLIAFDDMSPDTTLFWNGKKPILLSFDPKKWTTTLRYLKGTVKADDIIFRAVEWYNREATDSQSTKRYVVNQIFGTDGRKIGISTDQNGSLQITGASSTVRFDSIRLRRILGWKAGDIGPKLARRGSAISDLSLCDELTSLRNEISVWRSEEKWYAERGIPWKKGILLHGAAGTGKTSFVRAVAEDEDLPVFVFHLATLFSEEMYQAWTNMLNHVPCIALIEDFDAVFTQRENVAGNHLTFDAVLNCLDGVSRSDGLLVFVTTNHLDRLDAALYRPGRLDHIVEVKSLTREGRLKMARRILGEEFFMIEHLVHEHQDSTGAEFQLICEQKALEERKRILLQSA